MRTRRCSPWEPFLAASACRDLTERQEEVLLKHLQDCPSCSRTLSQLREILREASHMEDPPRPPQIFWENLPGRIVQRIRTQETPRFHPRSLRWAFPLLSAAMVFLLVGVYFQAYHRKSSFLGNTGHATSFPLERALAMLPKEDLDELAHFMEWESPWGSALLEVDSTMDLSTVEELIYSLLSEPLKDPIHIEFFPFSWPSILEYDLEGLSEQEQLDFLSELDSWTT